MDVLFVLWLAWAVQKARDSGGAWYGGGSRSAGIARGIAGAAGGLLGRGGSGGGSSGGGTSGGRTSGGGASSRGPVGGGGGSGLTGAGGALAGWGFTGAGTWTRGRGRAWRNGWRVGRARARRGVGPWTGRTDPPPPSSSTPPPSPPPPPAGGSSPPSSPPAQPGRVPGTITVVRPDPHPPISLPPRGPAAALPVGGDGATSGPPIAIPPPAAIAAGTPTEGDDDMSSNGQMVRPSAYSGPGDYPAPAGRVGPPASARGGNVPAVGAGRGGGVAAAEYGLPDVLALAAETRAKWQRASEAMSAGQMGTATVEACRQFAEAAAQFDRAMMQLHGGMYAAANDAAVVGQSGMYLRK